MNVSDFFQNFTNSGPTTSTLGQLQAWLGSYFASPQKIRAQTNSSGSYTWTFPTPFSVGTIPVITAVSESNSSTVVQNVQIVGAPTNTSVTVQVLNFSSVLTVLGNQLIGTPSGTQAYVHLTAIAP